MSDKGCLDDDEKAYGGVMDNCLKDTAIKTGSGVGIGALASFLFTKGRKWPMIFGAGIGLGLSASACQAGLQSIASQDRRQKTYIKPEFQKDPRYDPNGPTPEGPCQPCFDDCDDDGFDDDCDNGGSSITPPIIDVVAASSSSSSSDDVASTSVDISADVITSDVTIESAETPVIDDVIPTSTISTDDDVVPNLIVTEAVADDVNSLPQIVMTSSDEIAAEIPSSPDE